MLERWRVRKDRGGVYRLGEGEDGQEVEGALRWRLLCFLWNRRTQSHERWGPRDGKGRFQKMERRDGLWGDGEDCKTCVLRAWLRWMTLSFSRRNPSGSFFLLGHQLCLYWVHSRREQHRQKASSFRSAWRQTINILKESITWYIMRSENRTVWWGDQECLLGR